MKTIRFYTAGAMLDIGKVVVGNDFLEKPGKLDGSGYSRGTNASQLSFEERLMACIGI